jgi:hypothetical protein
MENKWILEDAVSILKTLGHINLWYLEEQFGQLQPPESLSLTITAQWRCGLSKNTAGKYGRPH